MPVNTRWEKRTENKTEWGGKTENLRYWYLDWNDNDDDDDDDEERDSVDDDCGEPEVGSWNQLDHTNRAPLPAPHGDPLQHLQQHPMSVSTR